MIRYCSVDIAVLVAMLKSGAGLRATSCNLMQQRKLGTKNRRRFGVARKERYENSKSVGAYRAPGRGYKLARTLTGVLLLSLTQRFRST